MKLLYCAPPRSRNGATSECGSAGENCWPFFNEWNQGTIAATGQRYPMDFSVFAFGSVSNMQDVQGPVAAGGPVALTSFNLNWGQKEPVGLYSPATPTLSNGQVSGAVYTASGYKKPDSVTVLKGGVYDPTSIAPTAQIDFASARTKLQSMSSSLQSFRANGTTKIVRPTSSPISAVIFAANDPHLNVFDYQHDASVRSIVFEVPTSSTVVVNVLNTSVTFENLKVYLNGLGTLASKGLRANRLLWNFPHARSLTSSSVEIPGSILAPYAAVSLNWGNLNGTLVAQSVNSTSEFHFVPFSDNWLVPQ